MHGAETPEDHGQQRTKSSFLMHYENPKPRSLPILAPFHLPCVLSYVLIPRSHIRILAKGLHRRKVIRFVNQWKIEKERRKGEKKNSRQPASVRHTYRRRCLRRCPPFLFFSFLLVFDSPFRWPPLPRRCFFSSTPTPLTQPHENYYAGTHQGREPRIRDERRKPRAWVWN